MSLKIIVNITILLLIHKVCLSQDMPSIQLDRPDQTECPFITPTKYIQVEHGFTYLKQGVISNTYLLPTSLIKYGVNSKFELRLIADVVNQKVDNNKAFGLKPITIGFKTTLLEEKKFIPKTSFIGHLNTSIFGSKELHTNNVAPAFRFTMQHSLPKNIALAYNIGAEWDGENATPTYIYTLTTGFSFTNKLGMYTELFGFIHSTESNSHNTDAGLTYLINQHVMIDASAGFDFVESKNNHYASLGLSYRFKTIN